MDKVYTSPDLRYDTVRNTAMSTVELPEENSAGEDSLDVEHWGNEMIVFHHNEGEWIMMDDHLVVSDISEMR